MACERGQTLHTQFERAVAARIRAKELSHPDLQSELTLAKKNEDLALLSRSAHISRCEECWVRPPK